MRSQNGLPAPPPVARFGPSAQVPWSVASGLSKVVRPETGTRRARFIVVLVIGLLMMSASSCERFGVTVEVHADCAYVVAEAAFALGAAALFTAAATGGLKVAGVFVAPRILGYLGNAATNIAALEAIAVEYLC